MAKNLLIVESPAKAKTINKYLGKDFDVLASYGHVRDLVPKEGAVDPDRDFAMNYAVIDKNEKHVDAIARAAAKADALYLATDLDREGEAISWHIAEILQTAQPARRQGAASRRVFRDHAARDHRGGQPSAQDVARPGQRAAGAARARLSGRLQPVAGAVAQGPARPVGRARAVAGAAHDRRARGGDRSVQGARILDDPGRLRASGSALRRAPAEIARQEVRAVRSDQRTRCARGPRCIGRSRRRAGSWSARCSPRSASAARRPPFTTSTLQQEAARKLGFTTSRTMRIAQRLYEGVTIGGEGTVGLITYMRTDSVNLGQRRDRRDAQGHRPRLRRQGAAGKSQPVSQPSPRTRRKRTRRSARLPRCTRRRAWRSFSTTTNAGCTI